MRCGKRRILLRSLLIAPLLVSLSLVLPAGGASAAGEGGYVWTDTLFPGSVSASALLYVDSRNELYCGTEVGLFCQTPGSGMWTQMSQERIKVRGLAWDGSSLYVGGGFVDSETPGGVWRFEPAASKWSDISGDLPSRSVSDLCRGGSSLYAAVGGVCRYDPVSGTWVDLGRPGGTANVQSLAWGGHFYAGTYADGVWSYDPVGGWQDTGLEAAFGGSVGVVSMAYSGSVLFAGTGGGVWSYDPGQQKWAKQNELKDARLLWVGSVLYAASYGEVWRHDPVAGTWDLLGSTPGSEKTMSLAWDGSRLYVGSSAYGVYRFDPSSGSLEGTGEGLAGSKLGVNSLAWTGSVLCVGSVGYPPLGGIWSFEPARQSWTNFGLSAAWPSMVYNSLAWDGSSLYAGSYMYIILGGPRVAYNNALSRYDTKTGGFSILHLELLSGAPRLYSMAWDGSGLYIASGTDMMTRYDPATGSWTNIGGTEGYQVTALYWDGTRLWAGVKGQGIWYYEPAKKKWTPTGENMSGFTVYGMERLGSTLYAGTDKGLYRYQEASGKWVEVIPQAVMGAVRYLAGDESGLYVGNYDRVCHYRPEDGTCTDTGFPSGFECRALAWDGSGLYVAGIWKGANSRGEVLRYAYQKDPVISSLSVTQGPRGTEVVINGSGFGSLRGGSFVSFGAVKATYLTSWSDDRIVCRVPALPPGPVQVTVSTSRGTSAGVPFLVTASALKVTSITPASGLDIDAALAATVQGQCFLPGARVRLENPTSGKVIEASGVEVVSPESIRCTFDLRGAPLGRYDVVVANPGGEEARLAAAFSVTNICGQGAGATLLPLGLLLGLLSLGGSAGLGRKKKAAARRAA